MCILCCMCVIKYLTKNLNIIFVCLILKGSTRLPEKHKLFHFIVTETEDRAITCKAQVRESWRAAESQLEPHSEPPCDGSLYCQLTAFRITVETQLQVSMGIFLERFSWRWRPAMNVSSSRPWPGDGWNAKKANRAPAPSISLCSLTVGGPGTSCLSPAHPPAMAGYSVALKAKMNPSTFLPLPFAMKFGHSN